MAHLADESANYNTTPLPLVCVISITHWDMVVWRCIKFTGIQLRELFAWYTDIFIPTKGFTCQWWVCPITYKPTRP